ncbi:MAG TPA: CDP-alcohol phosphatidyltransferase family protein [Polyangiaceae bacterium]|nr:CDP-alcohol phosphatidyltransferase family protein [Polyangiaceae bacterium]
MPPSSSRPPPRAAPAGGEALSLADALSLSRIAFAGALWLADPSPLGTLALMVASGLSDVADGWVARRQRAGRPPPPGGGRGAWLDPLCDKVFVLCLVAKLALRVRPPPWLLLLISAREIFVFAAFLLSRTRAARRSPLRITYTANVLGKATTALQFAALALLVAYGRAHPAVVATAAASAIAGSAAVFSYVTRALRSAEAARAGS